MALSSTNKKKEVLFFMKFFANILESGLMLNSFEIEGYRGFKVLRL